MRQLLIEEMKRAIELVENYKKPESKYWTPDPALAEIQRTFLQIRKHSIMVEKELRK